MRRLSLRAKQTERLGAARARPAPIRGWDARDGPPRPESPHLPRCCFSTSTGRLRVPQQNHCRPLRRLFGVRATHPISSVFDNRHRGFLAGWFAAEHLIRCCWRLSASVTKSRRGISRRGSRSTRPQLEEWDGAISIWGQARCALTRWRPALSSLRVRTDRRSDIPTIPHKANEHRLRQRRSASSLRSDSAGGTG